MDGIGENITPSAIADMSMMSAAVVAAVIFLDRDKGPPAQPEVLLIHMYRTTMHTMDTRHHHDGGPARSSGNTCPR